MSKKQTALILRAYACLDDVTPKKYDCGDLCGGACCENLSDGEDESGMLLLPGEKDLLSALFPDEYDFIESEDGVLAVCKGRCTRAFRPFACRVFPYYPRFDEARRLTGIRRDIRAKRICPLCAGNMRVSPAFLRGVRRAVTILSADDEIKAELIRTAEFLDSLEEFSAKLGGQQGQHERI